MNSKTLAYIGIVVAEIFWAASFVFTNNALTVFSPCSTVVMRISLATLLLLGYCLLRHELVLPNGREVLLFLLTGFFQPFLYFILEAYGLEFTNSPNAASLILALGPLISPFLAYILLRERVTIFTYIGLFISAGGILILVLVGQKLELHPIGVVLLAAAAITASLYCICLRKVNSRFRPATVVFYVDLFSLILFLPTWAILDHGKPLAVPTPDAIGSIVILAVFCSVISYIFFCNSVRHIGVARTNAFSNLIPAFTPVCVWALGGQMLAWDKYLGIFVVVFGLFISQITRQSKLPKL